MRRPVLALCLALPPILSACGDAGPTWPLRATLDDGQVLMGAVQTPVLVLEGGLGTLHIPWEDIGEVEPVEGEGLASSDGHVNVWLRNGSELTGHWSDAQLAMDLAVGGQEIAVDVPVQQLLRLQTQGGEVWPGGVVYRVRTTHGDDFLVDPDVSTLVLENEMGTFSPYLSECISAAPLEDADGDWRIELDSGTVLIGPLAHDAITFGLELGPEQATVPLDALVSLERQDWGAYYHYQGHDRDSLGERLLSGLPQRLAPRTALEPMAAETPYPAPVTAVPDETASIGYVDDGSGVMAGETIERGVAHQEVDGRFGDTGGQADPEGWFSNRALRDLKRSF